jgi:hypothetical protein
MRRIFGERGEWAGHVRLRGRARPVPAAAHGCAAATFTDSCGDREVARGDTRGTHRYGPRSDLGQTPIVADALAHDLVKATQQDIHEILIVANAVIQRGTARADNGCADHAQRTIWSDGKSAD